MSDPHATHHARGTFVVEITPEANEEAGGLAQRRMALAKTFQGDLEGTASGTMLTGHGQPQSSAAYVAIERFEGTMHGKEGSFLLVHRGVMTAAGQELSITVIPDSGTGELQGLAGTFHLAIADGEHRYDLEYTLP